MGFSGVLVVCAFGLVFWLIGLRLVVWVFPGAVVLLFLVCVGNGVVSVRLGLGGIGASDGFALAGVLGFGCFGLFLFYCPGLGYCAWVISGLGWICVVLDVSCGVWIGGRFCLKFRLLGCFD